MTERGDNDVAFRRPGCLPGVELVMALYRSRRFPMHTHPEYVVGAVVEGAEHLRFAGASHRVATGGTLFIRPDEAHANEAATDQPFGYRVFYIDAQVMRTACDILLGEGREPALFEAHVSADAGLFERVSTAHAALWDAGDSLEQQSIFAQLVGAVAAHGGAVLSRPVAPAALAKVRAHLNGHFRDGVSLDDLAAIGGTSPFHLVRAFKDRFGLTPVAYRTQQRVAEACRLLRRSVPIAEVALEVGFTDQSHLTRQFQRLMGAPPGRYLAQ